jgi:hypothetical protein
MPKPKPEAKETAKTKPDFNLYQCNPGTLKSTRTTCLPMEMLERLRTAWNERYPSHKIAASIKRKETLWAALRERMKKQYECASEYCAVQKLGGPEEKRGAADYFRPSKPADWDKKPRDWHDTESIAAVMEQYEDAYPNFDFIGPTPIDFDARPTGSFGSCVMNELCNFNMSELRASGKDSIGVVFNLDPHDRPGSHWVCAYIDIRHNHAYYYDSYGYEPCAEIRRLLRRCREQGCKNIYWNDIRHQRKTSECGTYCMYVIISLLKGLSFTDICKNRIDDDIMNSIRDLIYATENPTETAIQKGMRILRL